VGANYNSDDFCRFIYFFALCVKMSVIATGSIGERVEIDRYIFFSFLTSGFIFPLGLAWCWNDGWLQNLGFLDFGGVSLVHVMGGLSGCMGTIIIGPRIGLFYPDRKLAYILDDDKFIEQRKFQEKLILKEKLEKLEEPEHENTPKASPEIPDFKKIISFKEAEVENLQQMPPKKSLSNSSD
jgi:ammonia channel protein AmtB